MRNKAIRKIVQKKKKKTTFAKMLENYMLKNRWKLVPCDMQDHLEVCILL